MILTREREGYSLEGEGYSLEGEGYSLEGEGMERGKRMSGFHLKPLVNKKLIWWNASKKSIKMFNPSPLFSSRHLSPLFSSLHLTPLNTRKPNFNEWIFQSRREYTLGPSLGPISTYFNLLITLT